MIRSLGCNIVIDPNVTLYKDGWGEPIKVEGGQLADDLELLRIGADNYQLGSSLETCRGIETCIKGLKCEGQTALGPALTLAQGMVSASYIQVLDESQKESTWYYPIGNIQMDKKVPFLFCTSWYQSGRHNKKNGGKKNPVNYLIKFLVDLLTQ
ncbi:hypothetical protein Btru_031248 [Bulinus truncatus]|nr:hypothetical protein Btru_031248 [Bulinus truncatus]